MAELVHHSDDKTVLGKQGNFKKRQLKIPA